MTKHYYENNIERIVAIRDGISYNQTIREIELEIISYENHKKKSLESLRFRLDLGARAQ